MASTTDTKKKPDKRVSVFIPYIEGQDPEETVGVNGVFYKIRKGEVVEVPRAVASILSNSNKQIQTAETNRQKYKTQVTEM